MAVLAASTGLADVLALRLRHLADGLAIRNLWLAHVGLHAKLAHHAIHQDFQVQFAHAGDDRLPAIRISRNFERRIFLRQLAQCDTHLFLVALRLRLDCNRDDRRRKLDRLEHDRIVLVADRIARGDVLHADARADIAGVDFADFLTLVGVHLQQASNALGPFASAVVYACRRSSGGPSTRG